MSVRVEADHPRAGTGRWVEKTATDPGSTLLSLARADGTRENWEPGEVAWFEYHCLESAESGDAPAWYRSHQQVTVLARNWADEEANGLAGCTIDERSAEGCPATYQVRFGDGLEWCVFEDELRDDPRHFYRPDPPKLEG